MIEHIVLMKKRPETSEAEMERALDALRALKEQIPGIVSFTAGVNFSPRGAGFTHAAVARFTDREALQGYAPHPAHQAVVKLLNEVTQERVIIDYEA